MSNKKELIDDDDDVSVLMNAL